MTPSRAAPTATRRRASSRPARRAGRKPTSRRLAKGDGRVALNPEKGDKPGPISLGAAVSAPATEAPAKPAEAKPEPTATGYAEPPKPESRIVVIGDSDFASNGILGVQGNRDFFLNSVNWLAQQENLIAIRPREAGGSAADADR